MGVDLATADARAVVVDETGKVVARARAPMVEPKRPDRHRSEQDPNQWVPATTQAISTCVAAAKVHGVEVTSICVSATSGTVVAIDDRGSALTPALMYDDARAADPLSRLAAYLATKPKTTEHVMLCHASDLLNSWLCNDAATEQLGQTRSVSTDWSHALKTGYEPTNRNWSTKTQRASKEFAIELPLVLAPGSVIGEVGELVARQTGLNDGCQVILGMTDGCTSHIASGSMQLGAATTTIGTTLVTKIVSNRPISGAGFYGHFLPDNSWLVGGASNVGGNSLTQFESAAGLAALDEAALKHGPSNLIYYPLATGSERFPLPLATESFTLATAESDSTNQVERYRAALEGVAFNEKLSYETLASAGAPRPLEVFTGGGGSRSNVWCQIRASVLNLPVTATDDGSSDVGAALIAWAAQTELPLDEALGSRIITGRRFEPDPAEVTRLSDSYGLFLEELKVRGWLAP